MRTVIDSKMAEERTLLTGEILRFRFRDEAGSFAVAVIRTAAGSEEVVCGPMPGAEAGRQVELEGVFATHPDYGREFRISKCKTTAPESPSGLIRFLSAAVPGLGPKKAAAIVDHFGEKTMDILNRFPKKLKEVPGIGAKRAAEINRIWKESSAQRETLIFLQGLGTRGHPFLPLHLRL